MTTRPNYSAIALNRKGWVVECGLWTMELKWKLTKILYMTLKNTEIV